MWNIKSCKMHPYQEEVEEERCALAKTSQDSRWPDGLPNLHGVNKDRVASANALYAFCVEVMEACEKHSVLFTVENPTNSLMWETSFFAAVLDKYFFTLSLVN